LHDLTTTHQKLHSSRQFQGRILPAHPTSGTEDDDDNRDDEHAGENEAPVRAVDEATEAPLPQDPGRIPRNWVKNPKKASRSAGLKIWREHGATFALIALEA